MAEAEERGDWVGFPRLEDGRNDGVELAGVEYRRRDLRPGEHPSHTLTEKARSWRHWRQNANERATTRTADQPIDTMIVGHAAADMRFSDDPTDVGYTPTHILQGGAGGEGRPRPVEQPAPTQSAKGTATVTSTPDVDWHGQENADRRDGKLPATTVQGDDRIWERGHKINQRDIDRLGREAAEERYGNRAGSTARRVAIEEAGVLQGFPADYPWQGTKTSMFRQCGNSVPPAVAYHVLLSVLPESYLVESDDDRA